MTASYHVLPNLLSINHSIISRYIAWATDNIVKYATDK
jgi:hypothetical protein